MLMVERDGKSRTIDAVIRKPGPRTKQRYPDNSNKPRYPDGLQRRKLSKE